jgi:hypothetical protein
MKTYSMERFGNGHCSVVVHDSESGKTRGLPPRYDLRNHSPDGFAWGYGGSGPSQLALAILADHFGDDEKALRSYQDFKFWRIAPQKSDRWKITSDEIDKALVAMALAPRGAV